MTTNTDTATGKRELSWAGAQLLSIDEERRTVDYVLSDDSVDSYDEIVEQSWRLERFKKNPVVLYSHNRQSGAGWLGGSGLTQGETFPVGRIIPETLKRKGNQSEGYRLIGTVQFIPEDVIAKMGRDGERIEAVWQLVRTQFLRAGSVGFYPHDVRRETHDDVDRYVLSDNELFEFSVCPIGANANAVANERGSREERHAYLDKRIAEKVSKTQPAASGQEQENMNEAEFKARLAELEKQLEQATTNEKAAIERAGAAESKLKEVTTNLEAVTKQRDDATEDLAEAQKSLETVTAERDAFEGEAIEAELAQLVGKKFHSGELSDMREDRKRLGKAAFAERMGRRADLATSQKKLPEDTIQPELGTTTTTPGAKTSAYLNDKQD